MTVSVMTRFFTCPKSDEFNSLSAARDQIACGTFRKQNTARGIKMRSKSTFVLSVLDNVRSGVPGDLISIFLDMLDISRDSLVFLECLELA